jgi:hypothetical protein
MVVTLPVIAGDQFGGSRAPAGCAVGAESAL